MIKNQYFFFWIFILLVITNCSFYTKSGIWTGYKKIAEEAEEKEVFIRIDKQSKSIENEFNSKLIIDIKEGSLNKNWFFSDVNLKNNIPHLLFNGSLKNLMEASKEDLLAINGIGTIMADSIVEYFSNNHNKLLIEKCIDGGLIFKKIKKIKNSIISDKTFVFTGTLKTMNRNDAKKIIESYGAKSSSSISKNTDYVIAGSTVGFKIEKAKKLNLLILNELEFQQLIKKL